MQLPGKIRKVIKRGMTASLVIGILFLVLGAGAVWLGVDRMQSARNVGASEPVFLDYAGEEFEYSCIEVALLSDSFASFEANEEHSLYFALDSNMVPYVICMDNQKAQELAPLMEYTYDVTGMMEQPEPVLLTGYSQSFDGDMEALVIENFNYFWGSQVITAENFAEYFGGYYLDNTITHPPYGEGASEAEGWWLFAGVFIPLGALLIAGFFMRKRGVSRALEGWSQEDLEDAERELKDGAAEKFKASNVYVTPHYLVGKSMVVGMIPFRDLAGIKGRESNGVNSTVSMIFTMKDGRQVEGVKLNDTAAARNEIQSMAERIRSQVPGLNVGTQEADQEGRIYFYERKGLTAGEEEEKSACNVPLGMAGALLGALLGGAIWLFVAKLGYIVAVIGLLIVIFSCKGFEKLGGRLTRLGVVFSVVISVLVIVAANYISYAWELMEAINSYTPGRSSLPYILAHMHEYMVSYELWPYFIKDLAVGLIFTAAASISFIVQAFGRGHRKKR